MTTEVAEHPLTGETLLRSECARGMPHLFSGFTQPRPGEAVTAHVDNALSFRVGETRVGTRAGCYRVAKILDGAHVRLVNLGGPGVRPGEQVEAYTPPFVRGAPNFPPLRSTDAPVTHGLDETTVSLAPGELVEFSVITALRRRGPCTLKEVIIPGNEALVHLAFGFWTTEAQDQCVTWSLRCHEFDAGIIGDCSFGSDLAIPPDEPRRSCYLYWVKDLPPGPNTLTFSVESDAQSGFGGENVAPVFATLDAVVRAA